MPAWVIVAESTDGIPIVLADWVLGETWVRADAARRRDVPIAIFRDRWRAKRQLRRLARAITPRTIRYDRL
jgi:hypothetical protein